MSKDTGGPQVKLNPDKGKSPEQLEWERGYAQGLANAKALHAPQAHAVGQEELAALDRWFQDFRHGWKSEKDVAFDAWQARAALAQRQPLTWEQIESIRAQVLTQALQLRDGCDDQTWDHWFACAIEAAHGIGATTEKEPNK